LIYFVYLKTHLHFFVLSYVLAKLHICNANKLASCLSSVDMIYINTCIYKCALLCIEGQDGVLLKQRYGHDVHIRSSITVHFARVLFSHSIS